MPLTSVKIFFGVFEILDTFFVGVCISRNSGEELRYEDRVFTVLEEPFLCDTCSFPSGQDVSTDPSINGVKKCGGNGCGELLPEKVTFLPILSPMCRLLTGSDFRFSLLVPASCHLVLLRFLFDVSGDTRCSSVTEGVSTASKSNVVFWELGDVKYV
jgi:hypothetical protein